ncbi:unnamed protein product [Rotaria sp. Silwood2]|nr:unnamed protein product [Rotaria sp. Silwood2]
MHLDLVVAKQQYDDLKNTMRKKIEIDKQELIHKIRRECKQEKDELVDIQEKLQRDLNASLESQRRLNEKIQGLERKNDKLQTTVHELGETSRHNQQLIAYREVQQKINLQSVEIESLQMTVHDKDTEILETRETTKKDCQQTKLCSIQKDIDMNDELKDRIKQLENELKDQRYTDRNTIYELENCVADLQKNILLQQISIVILDRTIRRNLTSP